MPRLPLSPCFTHVLAIFSHLSLPTLLHAPGCDPLRDPEYAAKILTCSEFTIVVGQCCNSQFSHSCRSKTHQSFNALCSVGRYIQLPYGFYGHTPSLAPKRTCMLIKWTKCDILDIRVCTIKTVSASPHEPISVQGAEF
ncbi:hypothetical protein E4T42_00493 [Aureobasidium subglaciale]|nr:hypothetical protein E4T42_00493 [Aureobasidium subglaciale]